MAPGAGRFSTSEPSCGISTRNPSKPHSNASGRETYGNNPALAGNAKFQPLIMDQVAEKYGWPEPLVWSLALEGKADLERFKALDWGLRI